MSNIKNYRNKVLRLAEESFDAEMRTLKYYLKYDKAIEELARVWFGTYSLNLAYCLGINTEHYPSHLIGWYHTSYDDFHSPKFFSHFVGYHLLDDGYPAIVYHRLNDDFEWKPCSENDNGARPYWIKNTFDIEPRLEILSIDNVIKTINFYNKIAEDKAKEYEEDHSNLYGKNETAKLWLPIIEELISS
jgi:hypothetical protein